MIMSVNKFENLSIFEFDGVKAYNKVCQFFWITVYAAAADYSDENGTDDISSDRCTDILNNSNNSNNNVNVSNSEFRTISLGIHSELAKLRTAARMMTPTHDRCARKPPQRECALDIARQITGLDPEPLFITACNNGSDMCVAYGIHNDSNCIIGSSTLGPSK